VFLDLVEGSKGFDLNPLRVDIKQLNWLSDKALELVSSISRPLVIYGNPPFGFGASLAVKFFNQAAKMNADVIAFILPASFKKVSVHRRLDSAYHLVEEQFDNMVFDFPDGGYKTVPCVMQVWKRSNTSRVDPLLDDGQGLPLKFTTRVNASLAIRRVGGRAGKVLEGLDYSESTTFFIKCNKQIAKIITNLDFTATVNDTAGVRSLAKSELCSILRGALL
jgi:hypothetical protein